jgi:hypothetical protein
VTKKIRSFAAPNIGSTPLFVTRAGAPPLTGTT